MNKRILDCWMVSKKLAIADDQVTIIYYLRGIVMEELPGSQSTPVEEGKVRFTSTSPIRSIIGNCVTTCSGSEYYLTQNKLSDDSFEIERDWTPERIEDLIKTKYLNHWLDGDNWQTI